MLTNTGCTNTPTRTVVEQPNDLLICKVPLDLTYPSSVNWQPVKFYVINRDIMQDILLGNENGKQYPDVIFAVDARGYENLSINMQQIINHLESTQEIMSIYHEYYSKDSSE